MNAIIAIVTGLIVTVGSGLIAVAPIFKHKERRLRVVGVCLTFTGGLFGVILGVRSAAKTESLVRNTAEILQTSVKTLSAIDETLTTSKGVLKQSRENLEKTNATLRVASATSTATKEASSFATGGDAFPTIFAYAVTREDGKQQIGFSLTKQGKYPLYGLSVHVGRPYKASAHDATVQTFGVSQEFREFNTNVSVPVWFCPVPEEDSALFTAYMTARNGAWEEVIHVRKIGTGLSTRWVIFGTNDIGHAPMKKILDLAEANFPAAERKSKIYPLSDVSLPVAPSHK